MKKLLWLSFIVGLLQAGVANAAPVTWTFSDVVMTTDSGVDCSFGPCPPDLAALNGSFVYDADTGMYSDVVIFSDAMPFIGNHTYFASSLYSSDSSGLLFWKDTAFAGHYVLYLSFGSALSNAGGTVALSGYETSNPPGELTSPPSGFAYRRNIVDATLTGVPVVPIPAAVWLFGSALFGLGWLKRRPTA